MISPGALQYSFLGEEPVVQYAANKKGVYEKALRQIHCSKIRMGGGDFFPGHFTSHLQPNLISFTISLYVTIHVHVVTIQIVKAVKLTRSVWVMVGRHTLWSTLAGTRKPNRYLNNGSCSKAMFIVFNDYLFMFS